MTARIDDDDDFTLVAEPRPASRARRGSGGNQRAAPRRWAWLGPLGRRPVRTIAGAIVSALLTSIVINALVLQKAKHPAPLFMPAQASKAPASVPGNPPAAVQAHVAPAVSNNAVAEAKQKDAIAAFLKPGGAEKPAADTAPATKPRDGIAALIKGNAADKPRSESAPAAVKSKDAIASLIKNSTGTPAAADEPTQAVAAAQQALVKLGFVLRADGVPGAATRQAVELFERDHGMQVDGDLSPRVTKLLSQISGVPIP